jgi:rhodanese-related sulfurtransferase
MRRAIREAAWLILLSCVVGFAFTAATKKGLFAEKKEGPSVVPQLIEIAEAKRIFDAGEGLFLDSRHEFDFNEGHIKGAINIPVDKFEEQRSKLASVDQDHLIIVYCDGADCNSSFEMGGKLFTAGFHNVRIFFSGWQDWQGNNYPTENSK